MTKTQCNIALFLASALTGAGYTANPATKEYVDAQVTILQSQIAAIPSGKQGPAGAEGPQGDPGPGVAAGGTTGQILAKASDNDFDTQWVDGPAAYTVGQQAMGGIVFYVDATGLHGLIAANADNNGGVGIRWSVNGETFATGDGIFSGQGNAQLAIALQAAAIAAGGGDIDNTAVRVCKNYAIQANGVTACDVPGAAGATCYADWYLPSKFELHQLYEQRNAVGGFANDIYWSSTEFNATHAFSQDFFGRGGQGFDDKGLELRVRCVRAF
ncbi:DUF1566 domain-containing protein [Legionella nagasakiensis]|uniref:DUF1566 domain-containing protein n=1 Tax=Legionella nagasakiensis TaxID=535290 RepID=UPI0010569273|nr:DUF1566 domain-containing protein [Legionella nagasakiensis]